MSLRERLWQVTGPICKFARRRFGPSVFQGGLPAGTFSEAQCITEGKVRGSIVLDGQPLPPIRPDSEMIAAGLQQQAYGSWQCIWSQRDNAFLASPSFAHLNERGEVCLEATYNIHSSSDPVWRRNKAQNVRNLRGDYTSIVSRWNIGRNYYHWFMDGLTRLIHLDSFPSDCRILVPSQLPAYARRSLQLLGLEDRIEEAADEDLNIERYWFAGPTMLSGCPDPAGVKWLRDHLLAPSQPPAKVRLYVERNAPTRTATNAAELREWFVARGWQAIDPGVMTLDEQIAAFSSAAVVAGMHGAAMTNLLWMPAGGKVLELIPSQRRNGCYAALALAVGLKHRSAVVPSDRRGNVHVRVQDLESFSEWAEG